MIQIYKEKGVGFMKTNLNVRMIIDSENNKTYLSIEGNVKNATEKEKIELRDTLTRAFSQILGIKTSSEEVEPEIISDFEPALAPSDAPSFIEKEMEEKLEEQGKRPPENTKSEKPSSKPNEPKKSLKEIWEELIEEFSKKGEVKLDFPVKYKGLTPYQVLAQDTKSGFDELGKILPILERNKARFPKNADAIKEIKEAMAEYEEIKKKVQSMRDSEIVEKSTVPEDPFDKMIAEIKARGDECVLWIEKVLRSLGTTLDAVMKKRDKTSLETAYNLVKEAEMEVEEEIKKAN